MPHLLEDKEPAGIGAGTQPEEPSSAAGNAEAHVQQIQRLCSPFMHHSMSTGYYLDLESWVTCTELTPDHFHVRLSWMEAPDSPRVT
jgi:hypothetical protein